MVKIFSEVNISRVKRAKKMPKEAFQKNPIWEGLKIKTPFPLRVGSASFERGPVQCHAAGLTGRLGQRHGIQRWLVKELACTTRAAVVQILVYYQEDCLRTFFFVSRTTLP